MAAAGSVQGQTAHPTPNATPGLQRLPAGTPERPPAKPEREDPPRAWVSAQVTPLTGGGWAMAFASRRGPGGVSRGPSPATRGARPRGPHAQPRRAARWAADGPARGRAAATAPPAAGRGPGGSSHSGIRGRPRPRRTERAGARQDREVEIQLAMDGEGTDGDTSLRRRQEGGRGGRSLPKSTRQQVLGLTYEAIPGIRLRGEIVTTVSRWGPSRWGLRVRTTPWNCPARRPGIDPSPLPHQRERALPVNPGYPQS